MIGSGEAITDGGYPVTISSITSWNATDTFASIDVIAIAVNTSDMSFATQTAGAKAERMRITGAGNVGIGVADPAAPLEIKANGSHILFDTPLASQNAWMTFADNGTNKWEINKSTTQLFTVYSYTLGAHVITMKEDGNVGIGISPSYPLDLLSTTTASNILGRFNGTGTGDSQFTIHACDNTSYASNDTCLKVPVQSGRSINAGGSINASGADYAEYETKRDDCPDIAKGDIVGFDIEGLLTDKWGLAITFGVKSTNPSYVGGDTWSSVDDIGYKPERINFEDDNSFEVALSEWNTELSNRQVKVDRIGYSGKVPVNILSGEVGDYVIPVQDVEGIKGEAVTEPTIEQYTKAVGQIRAIKDGVYTLALKMG